MGHGSIFTCVLEGAGLLNYDPSDTVGAQLHVELQVWGAETCVTAQAAG